MGWGGHVCSSCCVCMMGACLSCMPRFVHSVESFYWLLHTCMYTCTHTRTHTHARTHTHTHTYRLHLPTLSSISFGTVFSPVKCSHDHMTLLIHVHWCMHAYTGNQLGLLHMTIHTQQFIRHTGYYFCHLL